MRYITYSPRTGEIFANCYQPNLTNLSDISVPNDQGKLEGSADPQTKKVNLETLEIEDKLA